MERAFVQLPTGEVQFFFANDGVYPNTSEQNISVLKSFDNGFIWIEVPEIIGFRREHRDGIPVPILLPDTGDLLVVTEDKYNGKFKSTIYHEQIFDNWGDGYISSDDTRRENNLRCYKLGIDFRKIQFLYAMGQNPCELY